MKRKQSGKWDNVCLLRIGLTKDLTFVQLVEEARILLLFQPNFQHPVEDPENSTRTASFSTKFRDEFRFKSHPSWQFNHVTELLCAVAAGFGGMPVDHYYDDFSVPLHFRTLA